MADKKKSVIDYEQLSQELTVVMTELEQGDLGIDAAVATYERGLDIVHQLEDHLKNADNRVAALKAEYDDLLQEEE